MPAPADALFAATIHLMPTIENMFFDRHRFLKAMLESGVDKRPSGGEFAAFDIEVDGPGNISKQVTGSEAYAYGRRNIIRQGRVFIPTHIYAFAVEGKLLRHGQGTTGIENLLKLYPEASILDFKQRCTAQILMGNGAAASADGWTTLNGDTTYNPDGTALNGLLDFATPATQADVVENITKSNTTTFWYNQYVNVPSFATNGKRLMRDAYNQATMRSLYEKPPRLGFCDSTSFNNYYDTLDDQVRYASGAAPKTTGEEGNDYDDGLMFHKLELFADPAIDDNVAQWGHGANGGMYFLSPESFFILQLGQGDEGGVELTKGFFELRGPYKLEGRDAWGFEYVSAFQIACRNLKCNAAIEGTAIL